MPKLVKEKIADLELELALKKAVFNKFPDATVTTREEYYSKLVNRNYNKFVFSRSAYGLYLRLHHELEVDYGGSIYIVDILGTANQNYPLIRVGKSNPNSSVYDTIHVLDFPKELRKHKVRDDILNECRIEILDFIKKNPKLKLDETNLEPRLKKLLIFN